MLTHHSLSQGNLSVVSVIDCLVSVPHAPTLTSTGVTKKYLPLLAEFRGSNFASLLWAVSPHGVKAPCISGMPHLCELGMIIMLSLALQKMTHTKFPFVWGPSIRLNSLLLVT